MKFSFITRHTRSIRISSGSAIEVNGMGVARILLWWYNKGVRTKEDRSLPVGSRGRAPVLSGREPPEASDNSHK